MLFACFTIFSMVWFKFVTRKEKPQKLFQFKELNWLIFVHVQFCELVCAFRTWFLSCVLLTRRVVAEQKWFCGWSLVLHTHIANISKASNPILFAIRIRCSICLKIVSLNWVLQMLLCIWYRIELSQLFEYEKARWFIPAMNIVCA